MVFDCDALGPAGGVGVGVASCVVVQGYAAWEDGVEGGVGADSSVGLDPVGRGVGWGYMAAVGGGWI